MFWSELFFAVVVAALVSWLLVGLSGWRSPRGAATAVVPSMLFVFLMTMLVVWAGGVWLTPVGPALWGGYWLPFVLVGIVFTLVLASIGPPVRPPRTREEARDEAQAEVAAASIFGGFFWMLLIVALLAVVARYL